jgi:hypothetical protein
MKWSPGATIGILAAMLLLITAPSFAATTWSVLGESGSGIKDVKIIDGSSSYSVQMDLNTAALVGNNYSVYFSPTANVYDDFTQSIDSTVQKRFALTSNLVTYTLVNGDWQNSAPVAVPGNLSSDHKILTWTVAKSELPLATFYFGGDVAVGQSTLGKTAVAATPIPGAVWLLSSGILGLIGLKRRKS